MCCYVTQIVDDSTITTVIEEHRFEVLLCYIKGEGKYDHNQAYNNA